MQCFLYKVADAISDASITFGDETSIDDISYIVENDLILDSVSKEIGDIPNVEVLYGEKAKLYGLPGQEKNVNICMENGDLYICEVLVSY